MLDSTSLVCLLPPISRSQYPVLKVPRAAALSCSFAVRGVAARGINIRTSRPSRKGGRASPRSLHIRGGDGSTSPRGPHAPPPAYMRNLEKGAVPSRGCASPEWNDEKGLSLFVIGGLAIVRLTRAGTRLQRVLLPTGVLFLRSWPFSYLYIDGSVLRSPSLIA